MRNLKEQYNDCLASIYSADKAQRQILMGLILEFHKDTELVDSVLERMRGDEFKMGDDAREFFSRCADDIFKVRMAKATEDGSKIANSIRTYHPLFGASWWTK